MCTYIMTGILQEGGDTYSEEDTYSCENCLCGWEWLYKKDCRVIVKI